MGRKAQNKIKICIRVNPVLLDRLRHLAIMKDKRQIHIIETALKEYLERAILGKV